MEGSSRGDRKGLTLSLVRGAKPLIDAFADLVLPVCCVVCSQLMPWSEKGIVCGHCWSKVRELPHPRCDRCGHPRDAWSCRWCENLPPFVRSARSFCWIGAGTGKAIVHSLKYEGWKRVADSIAARMSRLAFPRDVVEERSIIIPLPLAPARLRERGFNQCERIARALAPLWQIHVRADLLERAIASRSQTELTPGERKGNVAGAFSVPSRARSALEGRHVVLLDDVVTTGATLREAASALFAAGARTISCMTFGRAPASGDRLPP